MAGDSLFAEVILNDGNQLAKAEEALVSLKSSLSAQGIQLDPRVAAEWSLKTVEYGGICRGESGAIRGAEYFNAGLVAGTARHIVTIEVSNSALSESSERLGAEKTPESFQHTNAVVCDILREQISEWLSHGEKSRWDPVRNNVVRLSSLPMRQQTA